MRVISDHKFRAENEKKVNFMIAQMRANFYEVTNMIKRVNLFVMHGDKFKELSEMNVKLKEHVVSSLKPQTRNPSHGLNLQNLDNEKKVKELIKNKKVVDAYFLWSSSRSKVLYDHLLKYLPVK